jgi:photosystem II stability/assembly factor-like uncharacterized protein
VQARGACLLSSLFYTVPRPTIRPLLLLVSVLFFISCKKDLIRPAGIIRIDSHTANRLNSILFINDSVGFVAGGSRFDEANILITKDGGYTWRLYVPPNTNKELFGVIRSPAGAVYIIGFDGNLLRSYDEGETWLHEQLRYESYKALAFADAEHALCAGGISFLRGDALWIDSAGHVTAHDSLGYELNDIALLPGGAGFRCGYGVMQYTTDGGKTWQWTELRNDNYTALDVHSATIAFACGGEGSIVVTRNGGRDWETLRNGNDLRLPKYRLRDLVFIDGTRGYAAGEEGKVIYTDDAGRHWSELEPFTDENLHGIALCPDGDLLVCGEGGALWRIRVR